MNKFKNYKINSLRNRYLLGFSVLGVIVVALSAFQFIIMDDIFTFKAKKDLISVSKSILSLDLQSSSFLKDIVELESEHNIYVELYNPRDVLIYTTGDNDWLFRPENSSIDTSSLSPRIMKILGHTDIDSHSYFETRQEFYANARYIVYGNTLDNTTCEIYYSTEVIKSSARTASWTLFTISVIIFLLLVAVTYTYLKSFIIPLEEINSVTKKITEMDFSHTCPEYSIKELNELSESINALSSSLGITLEDLKNKNLRLQKEYEKEHTLVETRKEFIASASHELKTPIAIIQGYAEGLKYGITDGKDEEYYDIIIDETEKMNSLVLKLLEQTKYDYGGYKVSLSTFNIKNAVIKATDSRLKLMENEGITFIFDIDDSFNTYSDESIFSLVISNYLSNAISHCEFEKIIKIKCEEKDDNYRISVINTGKPISQNDINNIWDSFYRSDKAHSRGEGRFGLGLSIVSSMQKIIGQKYGVINGENSVEFWFEVSKFYT